MGKIRRAIGLMSGTSMDGIDVAVLETDGREMVRRLGGASVGYCDTVRDRLRLAIDDAVLLGDRLGRPGSLAETERVITDLHVAAVRQFLVDQNWSANNVDVIGFHGQTVLHRPEKKLTVQIGDGDRLQASLGIPVVYDLRAADVAAGGQGAPLAPVYHQAMAAKVPDRPVAVVNIGGVANITWIGNDDGLVAFDTGPGNAPIDDWMMRQAGVACDENGMAAAAGVVDDDCFAQLLGHRYFMEPPPKSLDRNAFDFSCMDGLSVADGAATLTAFAVAAIARASRQLRQEPALWVVCGGGRRNPTLMSMLAGAVENAVVPAEALCFDGDLVEAEAWAYLAVRSLEGLPISFPDTTGVREAASGGVLVKG